MCQLLGRYSGLLRCNFLVILHLSDIAIVIVGLRYLPSYRTPKVPSLSSDQSDGAIVFITEYGNGINPENTKEGHITIPTLCSIIILCP